MSLYQAVNSQPRGRFAIMPFMIGSVSTLMSSAYMRKSEASGLSPPCTLFSLLQELNITVNVMNPNVVPAVLRNASLSLFYADPSTGAPVKFGMVQVTNSSMS